jgi:hypothetical protein
MSPNVVACPACLTRMRVPPEYTPGMQVRCPSCSNQFPLPAPGSVPAGDARPGAGSPVPARDLRPEADRPRPSDPRPPLGSRTFGEEDRGGRDDRPRRDDEDDRRRDDRPRRDDSDDRDRLRRDDDDDRPRRDSYDDDRRRDDRPRRDDDDDDRRRDDLPRRDYDDDRRRDDYEDDRRRDEPRYKSLDNKFEVRVGEWLEYGKAHWGAFLGPCIGYLIIVAIITSIRNIPYIGPVIEFFLDPPLQAGFSLVAMRQLTGRRWSFGDFFGGFKYYLPLLVISLLQSVLALVCLGPGGAVLAYGAYTDGPPEVAAVGVGLMVCGAVPFIYLVLRGFVFATQLVLDRDYGPIEAIQGSWHLTANAPFSLLGAMIVLGIIGFSGILACCVGVLFTMPLFYLTWNAGYLLVAGRRPPLRSPDAYRSRDYDDSDRPRLRLPDDYDRGFRNRGPDDRDRDRDDRDRDDRGRDRYGRDRDRYDD